MSTSQPLPPGFVLRSDYLIEQVLGHGGFGFTYRAQDRSLDIPVAVKEFFPLDMVERQTDMSVAPVQSGAEAFAQERLRYVREAQALARYKHDAIARVFRTFEENGTAYSVLELVDGTDMGSWLRAKGSSGPTQAELDHLSDRVLGALELLHGDDVLHRDISPRNILLRRADNSPVMIDFGAAKRQSTEISAVVHFGVYSPIELYAAGHALQGPWTDIYSFAAVLHRAVSGNDIDEASLRAIDDRYRPLSERIPPGRYRPSFLKAIDWGLVVQPKARPQSVSEWRSALLPRLVGEAFDAGRAIGTRIFISYRRADTAHIAGRIFDRLESEFGAGEVFFDVDAIPIGVDFRTHIETRMAQSAVVLAIIGPRWLRQPSWFRRWRTPDGPDHVMSEIELAFASGVPVLPILVDGASMPREQDLPALLRALPRLNATVVRGGADFRVDLEKVLSLARALKARNAGQGPASG